MKEANDVLEAGDQVRPEYAQNFRRTQDVLKFRALALRCAGAAHPLQDGAMEDLSAKYHDIDWEGLTQARRALIGNPFLAPADEVARADAWFARNGADVPRAMMGLCTTGRPTDARKLALAAVHAHARARTFERDSVALTGAVDQTRSKGVRLEKSDLFRLGNALQRFQVANSRLIGVSSAMQSLRQELWTLCFGPHLYDSIEVEPTIRRVNVLILGETGTGKELVAEVLQAGAFAIEQPPAQTINCAALPKDLAESELFGFERGAHSTADHRREGKLVAAHGGSFFLDEIADLAPDVQVKLLSVLQNGKVTPLGANTSKRVDVRYIAATSRPLHQLVREDSFRQDLYERLAGHILQVPPLRERPEDIVAIGEHILEQLQRDGGSSTKAVITSPFSGAMGAALERAWLTSAALEFSWPGNVRELERVLRQRALGLPTRMATVHVRLQGSRGETIDVPPRILNCEATEEEVTAWYAQRVFEKIGKNVSRAADLLDIDRATVRKRLDAVGGAPSKKASST